MARAKKKTVASDKTITPPGAPAPQLLGVAFNLPGFKVARQVILPTLNLQVGQPRVLTIVEAMHISEMKSAEKKADADSKGKKEVMEPATVAPVTDAQTGEMFNMLMPAVLAGNLNEKYPDNGYVAKTFYMEKLPKRPGKRYFDFKLLEVTKDEGGE